MSQKVQKILRFTSAIVLSSVLCSTVGFAAKSTKPKTDPNCIDLFVTQGTIMSSNEVGVTYDDCTLGVITEWISYNQYGNTPRAYRVKPKTWLKIWQYEASSYYISQYLPDRSEIDITCSSCDEKGVCSADYFNCTGI